jgi:hypothetical protein
MGKKDLAITNFERSLELNPKNYELIQRLREAKGAK